MEIQIDDATIRYVESCIENAKRLSQAAATILASENFNVAYHLAVLSLEEVGKAGLISADAIRDKSTLPDREGWLKDKIADHTFKIFWAFWQADQSVDKMLPETFKNSQEMAKNIHQMRMAGLYASPEGVKEITKEAATGMVELARARLEIDNSAEALSRIRPEGLEDLTWFTNAINEPETKAQIFSAESFAEYTRIGNLRDWVTWLKQWVAEERGKRQAFLKKEIEREFPKDEEKFEPKWKVRFRLVSTGVMTLSQPVFNEWNKKIERVKFTVVKDNKKQGILIVDLIFPKIVNVADLYAIAKQEMMRIILMLNISTMGFFWWYNLLDFIEKFESMDDLENNQRIRMETQNPYIDVWKKEESRQKIDSASVDRMIWCYLSLPRIGEPVDFPYFGLYMSGLLYYSKHESEQPMMVASGMCFLECLYEALKFHGDIENRADLTKVFFEQFGVSLQDPEDQQNFRSVLEPWSEKDQNAGQKMTTDVATKMKIFCDQYILTKFRDGMPKKIKELQVLGDKMDEEEKDSFEGEA